MSQGILYSFVSTVPVTRLLNLLTYLISASAGRRRRRVEWETRNEGRKSSPPTRGFVGASLAPLVGSGAEPGPKINLVHF